MKEILWFYGFRVFYSIKHPVLTPFKILRKITGRIGKHSNVPAKGELLPRTVPKKIWIFWAQGWTDAPSLVKLCRDSWVFHNPNYEVVLLSQDDISRYVALDYSLEGKKLTPTNYSNILRLSLLSRYGGVWVDATTFCSAPLDRWMPFLMQSGFFAFEKPKTTVADWILAAEANNPLISCWEKYVKLYWKFAFEQGPYFWPHYLFEYMLLYKQCVRDIWSCTPRISSDGPYEAQRFFKEGNKDMDMFAKILLGEKSPVHKLDWRMDVSDSVLSQIRLELKK